MNPKTLSPGPDNELDWLGCLKASGYRLTQSRRVVVETLATSQRALNATEIFELARQKYPALGLVGVYRTLEKLEELDLIQRVHHPDGCQAFIAGFTGHQHLLICRHCGKTEFFEGDDLDLLFERVALESGYQVQEHWLQLFGLCRTCQGNA
jgi:Fur family transcriptional regulator, ferric uptake regulator